MHELQIILNQDYKSFKTGFSYTFKWDLIIISGTNGTGKSQLFDIIRRIQVQAEYWAYKLWATIGLDWVNLEDSNILYRSFKENINLAEITQITSQWMNHHFQQVLGNYQWNTLLNPQHQNLIAYSDSAQKARTILIEKYGTDRFNSGKLSQSEVFTALPANFIWKPNDVFSNTISEKFMEYAIKVNQEITSSVNKWVAIPLHDPQDTPWKKFNKLLGDFGIKYRVKDEYYREWSKMNEDPKLFALDNDWNLDLNNSRNLADLSDWEKAIISLAFVALTDESDYQNRKILLLDEFDATLNPSLTQIFFDIIHKYFIERGLQVIIITHSPTTIALAPEYTRFYEVFDQNTDQRILQSVKWDYAELIIANKEFYDQIKNKDQRINELNGEIQRISSQFDDAKKIQILSEGKNIEHIRKAISILEPSLLDKINIISGDEGKSWITQLKTTYEKLMVINMPIRFLFIRDCDAESNVTPLTETDRIKKYCFLKNTSNHKAIKGIENLYPESLFSDDLYTNTKTWDYGQPIYEFNKNNFLAKVQATSTSDIFQWFIPLIEKIKDLIVD